MFNQSNKIEKLEEQLSNAEEIIKIEKKRRETAERDLELAQENFNSMEKILRQELQTEILKATEETDGENKKLEIENGVLKEKVAILEKAFENMGFDVKDMKNILNKLADAVVAKNQVNVIK